MAKIINRADILFITVNDHESKSIRSELARISKNPEAAQGQKHRQPYDDFGIINGQRVVHATSMMGSGLAGGSRETTRKAIDELNPQLLIAVGICWGALEDSGQLIGDVIISQQVQLDHNLKIGEHSVVPRGAKQELDATAIKQLRSAQLYQMPELNIHVGTIISADTLFDNLEHRNRYRNSISGLKGGEMEAMGIYEAIRDSKSQTNWIVVKGICDWGYKKNADEFTKEKNQEKAALNAAKLCAHAIEQYHLTEVSESPDQTTGSQNNFSKNNSASCIGLSQIKSQNYLSALASAELNIEILGNFAVDDSSIVYWPVRVRQPNIVHAVQTYIAAGLQQKGFDVRLCLDDLGTPEGFQSMPLGVTTIKQNIKKWAAKTTSQSIADQIIEKSQVFTHFVGNRDDIKPMPGALEKLGDNLVAWLVSSDRLAKVLRESKLLISENSADLQAKPRKLLSPAVVWTVLQLIIEKSNPTSSVLTLGGVDEKPIWNAIPQITELTLTNILLPKVDGDMDSLQLRPGSRQDVISNITASPSIKDWFIRYGWHLPEMISKNNNINSFFEKNQQSDSSSAQNILEYFL